MTFVALSIPDWPTGAASPDLMAQLLSVAPRAAIDAAGHLAWLDARGLDVAAMVRAAETALTEIGVNNVTAGAAKIPVVAATAALRLAPPTVGSARNLEVLAEGTVGGARRTALFLRDVPEGTERAFLASLPLDVLAPAPKLRAQFDAVGLSCCGDLARLSRESVEVRFGREGLAAWKLARADDPRPIFSSRPRELPTASLDWTEFSTTDLEQLVFVLHSLLKTVCDALLEGGNAARELTLILTLENRTTITQPVGSARATAQRTTWLRLMRRALERITLDDRVTGIAVEVAAIGMPVARQGDLFDLGFASEEAAERAVEQVRDLQGDAVVEWQGSGHYLPERRVRWVADHQEEHALRRAPVPVPSARTPGAHAVAGGEGAWRMANSDAALHLLLLPLPREITVLTTPRRGFGIPFRYTDNGETVALTESLGPHCISGEPWADAFAREYHQGVRADGMVVLLYRDVETDRWYLAGWWE